MARLARATQLASSLRAESSVAGPSTISKRYLQFSAGEHANPPPAPIPAHTAYPFSAAIARPPVVPSPIDIDKRLLRPKNGWHVITHLNDTMRTQLDPPGLIQVLFGKTTERVPTGSILTVHSYTSPAKTSSTSFSGILMGVRNRGIDTSIRVRNIVNKVGVEMNYKLYSPMLKEIKIVRRAEKGKTLVKALKRTKAYYLRERPDILRSIAGSVKNASTEEARRR